MTTKNKKLLCLALVVFVGCVGTFLILKENACDTNENLAKYSVQWEYEAGEVIEINEKDIIYDKDNKEIPPFLEDGRNKFYKLEKGEYKLITQNGQIGEIKNIKIIVN